MAIRPLRQSPVLTGKEKQAKVTGEPDLRFHGTLTSQLLETFHQADPERETFDNLDRDLEKVFEHNVTVNVPDAIRSQLVFANNIVHARCSKLLALLDEHHEREIIVNLEEVITRREQQGDYWPEGRLNLGIAYACLGEYEAARRWLEDAVNILRYPSYVPRSQQMAA